MILLENDSMQNNLIQNDLILIDLRQFDAMKNFCCSYFINQLFILLWKWQYNIFFLSMTTFLSKMSKYPKVFDGIDKNT